MKNKLFKSTNTLIFSFLLFTFFAVNSCVSLVATYDLSIKEQIETVNKKIDRFYLTMLENSTADNDGRVYSKYMDQYLDIEVELSSLLNRNRVRRLNENSTRICEITLQLWIKNKEAHKTKNTISDGILIYNRTVFNDLFYYMQTAEEAKNYLKNQK